MPAGEYDTVDILVDTGTCEPTARVIAHVRFSVLSVYIAYR